MGRPVAGARLASRNHQRVQRLQSRNTDRRLVKQGANVKGVHGLSRKLERVDLGSAPCRVEWGDERERSQCTG